MVMIIIQKFFEYNFQRLKFFKFYPRALVELKYTVQLKYSIHLIQHSNYNRARNIYISLYNYIHVYKIFICCKDVIFFLFFFFCTNKT